MTTEDTVIVFTARSPARIVREGGSQAWVLNPDRARQCTWLVCTQNTHNRDHQFSGRDRAARQRLPGRPHLGNSSSGRGGGR